MLAVHEVFTKCWLGRFYQMFTKCCLGRFYQMFTKCCLGKFYQVFTKCCLGRFYQRSAGWGRFHEVLVRADLTKCRLWQISQVLAGAEIWGPVWSVYDATSCTSVTHIGNYQRETSAATHWQANGKYQQHATTFKHPLCGRSTNSIGQRPDSKFAALPCSTEPRSIVIALRTASLTQARLCSTKAQSIIIAFKAANLTKGQQPLLVYVLLVVILVVGGLLKGDCVGCFRFKQVLQSESCLGIIL